MYRKSITTLLISSCLIVSGCGDSHEKVMRSSIAEMKNMIGVLEGISTAEDAKKAKSKLENIGKRMKSLEARAKKLGEPSKELEAKLKEKYEGQLNELMPKMMKVMFGMKPEVAAELQTVMQDMPNMN